MIKRVITVALLLALVAGSAFAGAHPGGLARQLALGGSAYNPTGTGGNIVLNPFIWDDPTVMLLNPAYQNMYRDYAWMAIAGGAVSGLNSANANGYGHQFAGVNFAFGKELAIGANLSFDPSFANFVAARLNNFVGNVSGRPAQGPPPPIDVFEAVASYDLGSIDVGFGFLYGWSSNTSTSSTTGASTDNANTARVLGFRFGVAIDLGGGMAFDADAALRLDKATDKLSASPAPAATALGEYSATATEIQVDGRFKLKMSNKVNFIPYFAFVTISGEPKQDTPPTPTSPTALPSVKYSAMVLAVGAGMDYKVSNFYFAGGVSYQYGRFKVEQNAAAPSTNTSTSTLSASAIPVINLGVEWTLLDWLIGRMGYYRTFQSLSNKTESTAAGVTTTSETSTWNGNSNVFFSSYTSTDNGLVTLGLGLRFGNFSLDGTVSEEALRRGFGLIGAQDNINTFGYVNVSYCFE